jgi:hypothetical protein
MKKTLLACLLLTGSLRAAPVKLYVTLDGARLLAKPAAFSKSYGSLKLGQLVWAEHAGHGYYKVSVSSFETLGLKKGKGYLSGRALQEERPRIGSVARKSSDASAEEVAAATKGFNKQVEAQYKKDNASLDYDLVSKLEERTRISDAQASLKDFREKGKLGEFAAGNKDQGGDDE